MRMERLRTLVEEGKYSFGPHAMAHGLEDGFNKEQCVGALLDARILEEYPGERRYLLLGRFHLTERTLCYIHLVCDLAREDDVRVITAYIPKAPEWESPWKRAARKR